MVCFVLVSHFLFSQLTWTSMPPYSPSNEQLTQSSWSLYISDREAKTPVRNANILNAFILPQIIHHVTNKLFKRFKKFYSEKKQSKIKFQNGIYLFNNVFIQNFVCFSLIILILPEIFLFYFKFIFIFN